MDRRRAAVDPRIAAAAAAAEAPNKDKYTHEREKERFLQDLRQFHEGRGTSVPRWPYIGGKPVDLHALYTAVTQLGGWEKVSSDETWAEVQEQFGIPVSCGNADYALRQVYIRYLNAYERLHHFGLDPDSHQDGADLDDFPSSRRKTACPASGVAVTYNYQQHNLLDSTREMLGLPKESSRQNEYLRIERSLMSGLPNELDFAVNICLLLSTEGKHTLKGIKAVRIVELLLSHVGICKEELALIWLIPESKLNFLKFWNESVNDHEVKELLCPECLLVGKVEEYQMENETEACGVDLSKVLHLGRGVGAEDHEAQRVIQLAVILRNLSLEEENLEYFASSLIIFRFVMMCVYCSSSCIRQLALDTLANIAFKIDVLFLHKMSVDPVDCGLSQLVLRTISAFLKSPDKFEVVSALEVLSRLCQVELNEDSICTQLGDAIYEHLVRLLTIHDLQLMVSALETIYQLSEIGTATSNRIADVRSSVDVLVALLTVEAHSYGPCNLPGVPATENTVEVQNPVQNQTMGPPSARPAPSVSIRPSLPLSCSTASHVLGAPNSQSPLLPGVPPSPIVALSVPSSLASQSLGPTVRSASVPLVADSEAAACSWLLAQYELSPNSSLKKMEMYRKYASVFGVYGLQNLVSPMSFANCIRVTFPSIEQESVNKDGANEVIYKGIVCRQMPAPFSSSAGDLQPGHHVFPVVSSTGAVPGLIRAGQTTTQLAPPSAFAFSKTVTFPAIQQVLQCNQGRQQNSLLVACSNSLGPSAVKPVTTAPTEANFVKTLLASKVVQNMNRIQVQLTDGQDTAAQQATVNASASGIVECSTADGLSSNTKPFTGILPTVHKDSRCKTDDAVTMGKVGRGVVNENSYIQLTRGFDVVLERLSNLEDRFSLNCCKQTCTTVQTRPLDTFTSFDRCRVANVPAVMNGEFGLTRLSGKSRNNLAEDGRTTDWLNGKEPLPALNGIVKGLENNDCFSENSYPECVQLPTEKVEIWSSANQNEPAIVHHASGSNNIATRDIVSPFPHTANVDGLSDDVLEGTLQDDDKTASGIDLSHLCHDSGHSGAAVDKGRSQLPQFELDCSNSETVADNSEILLLEDFTVVPEEVLASDIPDRTCSLVAEGPDSSGPFSRCVRETESDSLVSSQEISRGISSTMQNSHSLDSVLTSHPLPIMIPASIQAKLASLQDASPSVSMICQPQLPFNATDVSIPQSSTSTIFQRPLINQNYSASFLQVVPVNDTGQQHLTPEVISSLQGSCEITADLHLTESQLVSTNVTRSTAVVMEPSAVCRLSHAAAGQSARQMIIAHPQGIQPTGVPVLQENSPSVPVTCANSSACPRLQFMTSMTSNLSNSVQIPQLHRFVAASTPGRFLIQRTQIVPQGQQPQPLRPLQQPFYQRFIVSQPGGLTQRQVLIQPSQVLMHQGVQGTGHARPVAPAGQMLPQQGPTPQPARLTAFRLAPMTNHSGNLVQHQGQQELGSQPLPVQQSQSSVQQGQLISQQDAESLGQSVDQQSQGHGQVVVPNQPVNFQQGQIGQVMTHQGQASRIFAQQGQILCHPGQQGQGQNSGPFVIQHNGGQFVLHSGSNNLPGCLMSIPVSSLQNGIGIKRLVETPKDQTVVGPSLMLSPCLTASSVACRIVTATMPLNLGLGVTTGAHSGQVGDEASASSVLSAKKRKPTVVTSHSRPAKKRKKEGEDQTACDGEVGQGRTPVQYLCEWNGCQRCFGSFNSIFQHVTKDHFESLVESSIVCKWTGCDSLKRQRWSFMTHLQERHLNEASLRAAAVRRQQQQLQGGCGSPPPESPAVPAAAAAVYPPNAALQAIRRFNARPPFPEFSDAKEGSISKHIHLTSALILRNLARYSLLGRSLIKRHEKHLALIAFSETESSSAISNCLWELHRH